MRIILSALLILGLTAAASAADKPAAAAEHALEDSGDIYGFSDNPDLPEWKGLRVANVKLGWIGLSGRRGGTYNVLNTTLEAEVSLLPRLSVTPALTFGYHRFNNVPLTLAERNDAAANGLTGYTDYHFRNRDRTAFSAISAGFKYQFAKREDDGPFGLAVTFEPKYAALDDGSGNRLRAFGFAGAFIIDRSFLDRRIYWTANAGAETSSGRDLDARSGARSAKINLSSAASYQFAKGWFAGAEVRHEIAYDGIFRKQAGHATYLGPTFFVKLGDWGVQAAWVAQVHGHAKAERGQTFNLAQFERHRARLRIARDF